jgi:CspA family cold shock protein
MPVNGKLKWFNSGKGYGFIQSADGTSDVLVHYTELRKAGVCDGLLENTRLECDLGTHSGRPCAQNLRLRRD